jgi:hypothetical protein
MADISDSESEVELLGGDVVSGQQLVDHELNDEELENLTFK